MIFRIRHRLSYRYAEPATLGPQTVRLRPRVDGGLRLLDHTLRIVPEPSLRSACLDEDGNVAEHAWFIGSTPSLELEAESTVETLRRNPFDFVLDADYAALPWGRRVRDAHPGLEPALAAPGEPAAARLGAAAAEEGGHGALAFLLRLTRRIHESLAHETRPDGDPLRPDETLRRGKGACRDFAALFCAAARSQGIPARFVSGYGEGDPLQRSKELHAWAEVFLPGAGWRGFDPSTGLACGELHVALAASPDPALAAPLTGRYGSSAAQSTLEAQVLFL